MIRTVSYSGCEIRRREKHFRTDQRSSRLRVGENGKIDPDIRCGTLLSKTLEGPEQMFFTSPSRASVGRSEIHGLLQFLREFVFVGDRCKSGHRVRRQVANASRVLIRSSRFIKNLLHPQIVRFGWKRTIPHRRPEASLCSRISAFFRFVSGTLVAPRLSDLYLFLSSEGP